MGYGGILNRESVEKGAVVANYPVADGYSINKGDVVDVVNGEVVSKVEMTFSPPTYIGIVDSYISAPPFISPKGKDGFYTFFHEGGGTPGIFGSANFTSENLTKVTSSSSFGANINTGTIQIDNNGRPVLIGLSTESKADINYIPWSNSAVFKGLVGANADYTTIAGAGGDNDLEFWAGYKISFSNIFNINYITLDSNAISQKKKVRAEVRLSKNNSDTQFNILGMAKQNSYNSILFYQLTSEDNYVRYIVFTIDSEKNNIAASDPVKTNISFDGGPKVINKNFIVTFDTNNFIVFRPEKDNLTNTKLGIYSFEIHGESYKATSSIIETSSFMSSLNKIYSVTYIGNNSYIVFLPDMKQAGEKRFYAIKINLGDNGAVISYSYTNLKEHGKVYNIETGETDVPKCGLVTYTNGTVYFVSPRANSSDRRTYGFTVTKTKLHPNGTIGDSITYTSTQAIALNSGTSGQNIDIVYSGPVEYEAPIGTKTESKGVKGYVPVENVLDVIPWYATGGQ